MATMSTLFLFVSVLSAIVIMCAIAIDGVEDDDEMEVDRIQGGSMDREPYKLD